MDTIIAILQVALGLGFVIFVHELGHFAVAKWCGVRCDKFMIGFDIGGYKLSRQWGETEYGIGILPLGGYVKMFGQEDNVAQMAEEMRGSKSLEGSPEAVAVKGPDGSDVWVHRRSYLAKSVPQRMAIISAGVIMNVIFAFIFAWVAFGLGVPEVECVVGTAAPGGPAWQAGLMPGDRITQLGEIADPNYKELSENVLLGDHDKGVNLTIRRAAGGTEEINLKPDTSASLARIYVGSTVSLRLDNKTPSRSFTPAGELAEGEGFAPGDEIRAANGTPVETYQDLAAKLLELRAEPITFTVIRNGKPPEDNPFGKVTGGTEATVVVPPNPMERLGIVPTLGPIKAIQANSPATEAGLEPGDQILSIDNRPFASAAAPEGWDPVTLGTELSQRDGESLTLQVDRKGETLDLSIRPRKVTWYNAQMMSNGPIDLEAFGVACELRAEVAAVLPGSSAEKAGLAAGDVITSYRLASTNKLDGLSKAAKKQQSLGEGKRNWWIVLQAIQDSSNDLTVHLTYERNNKVLEAALTPTAVEGTFDHRRGVSLLPLKRMERITSVPEQMQRAWDETGAALASVFRFLSKIGSQVPVTAMGGPVTIAKVAGQAAFEGPGALLIMLTMLSANLAVLNFLPIPVLDGGHMVFLAWEGITGRPPSEKILVGASLIGFAFIASLMIFVFGLDLGLIPRGLE